MLQVYQILTLLLSIILYPCLKINKKTAAHLGQRYACRPIPSGKYYWFHGASLGEIQGLLPLIQQLKATNPNCQILGTATSVKGYEKMLTIADQASLLPLDSPIYIRKFLKDANILQFVFGETELWPSLINFLNLKKTPIFLVNARLSEFNFRQYLFFRRLFSATIHKITKIFCISEEYQERFQVLGCNPKKIVVVGNLKYDQTGELIPSENGKELKKKFFKKNLPLLTLASIRPGEEAFLTTAIRAALPNFNIIIVPRHPEKFQYFQEYLKNNSLQYELRSSISEPTDKIILLDSIGELNQIFNFSNLSFVGGSLITGIGGHNPMEPAAYRNVILMGPNYQNQRDCVSELMNKNGIIIISSEAEMTKAILDYPNNQQVGDNAFQVWQSYQGISKKIFQELMLTAKSSDTIFG